MAPFTFASIIINILTIGILVPKLGNRLHKAEYSFFLWFPIIIAIVTLSYEFTSNPIPGYIPHNLTLLIGVRSVGMLLKLYLSYFLVIYCGFLVKIADTETRKCIHKMLILPAIIAAIEAALTPKYHFLFYYDSLFKCYDGNGQFVFYGLAAYCYIFGMVILISNREKIGKINFAITLILVGFSLSGMLANYYLRVANFDMFIHSISCMAMLFILADSEEMILVLRNKNHEISELMKQTIMALTSAIEVKDQYTRGHSSRVADYSKLIAQKYGLDETHQEILYYAALMHDIGKIGISKELINKPGKLTDEEYMEFKRHTTDGAKITRTITSLPEMEQVARWHHERFDGKGYPDGLKGNDIPLLVRMVTVADAYDAMTSDRPYRKAKSAAEARAELLRERGRQFDPELDDIMMGIIDGELKDSSPQKLKTVNIGAPACEQR